MGEERRVHGNALKQKMLTLPHLSDVRTNCNVCARPPTHPPTVHSFTLEHRLAALLRDREVHEHGGDALALLRAVLFGVERVVVRVVVLHVLVVQHVEGLRARQEKGEGGRAETMGRGGGVYTCRDLGEATGRQASGLKRLGPRVWREGRDGGTEEQQGGRVRAKRSNRRRSG